MQDPIRRFRRRLHLPPRRHLQFPRYPLPRQFNVGSPLRSSGIGLRLRNCRAVSGSAGGRDGLAPIYRWRRRIAVAGDCEVLPEPGEIGERGYVDQKFHGGRE
ncbi:hypothetical protein LINGRAHAP2_LOCUS1712 [Linum grandiflorum]